MRKRDSLFLLCAGIIILWACRTIPLLSSQEFRKNPSCFYWSETAYHYYFAKTASETGAIPNFDKRAQYPEGIYPWKELTPLMDLFYGKLHKFPIFQALPFHIFLPFVTLFWSSLSIVAVWLAVFFLTKSPTSAILSSGIFGLSLDFLGRTAPTAYLREHFALTFIFFGLAFLFVASEKRHVIAASTVTGACFAISLASWHMAQFVFIPIYLGIAWTILTNISRKEQHFPLAILWIICAFIFSTGFLLPHLRTKSFWGSPAFLLPLSLAIGWNPITYRHIRHKKILTALLMIDIFLLLYFITRHFSGTHFSDFSHVYTLVKAKLCFPAGPPQNPSLIPWEAKFMWNSGFNSPQHTLFFFFSLSLYFTAIVCWYLSQKTHENKNATSIITIAGISFFCLFLLMERFSPLALFFAAVSISMLPFLIGKKAGFFVLTLLLALEAVQIPFIKIEDIKPPTEIVRPVIEFLHHAGTNNDPVLAPFPMGSVVLAYAKKPTILHANIESKYIREKIRTVETSLFLEEEEYYQVCRNFGAKYFVYDAATLLSMEPGSTRYVNAVFSIPPESAAYHFHFAPEQLTYFHLVFQNDRYRIFEISNAKKTAQEHFEYQPLFDPHIFEIGHKPLENRMIHTVLAQLNDPLFLLKIAARLREEGDFVSSIEVAMRIKRGFPEFPGGAFAVGLAFFTQGNLSEAKEAWEKTFLLDPLFPFEKYEEFITKSDLSSGALATAALYQKNFLEHIGKIEQHPLSVQAIRERIQTLTALQINMKNVTEKREHPILNQVQ
jgi:MFS family permease/tetratricopeptide (TPR) repeat protein